MSRSSKRRRQRMARERERVRNARDDFDVLEPEAVAAEWEVFFATVPDEPPPAKADTHRTEDDP